MFDEFCAAAADLRLFFYSFLTHAVGGVGGGGGVHGTGPCILYFLQCWSYLLSRTRGAVTERASSEAKAAHESVRSPERRVFLRDVSRINVEHAAFGRRGPLKRLEWNSRELGERGVVVNKTCPDGGDRAIF